MARELKTLCPYCGVGCGILASTDGARVTRIKGDPHHPANLGKLCHKGSTIAQTVDSPTRLRYAMMRDDRRAQPRLAVSPSRAIASAAHRLNQILQTHGPQAIGFYLSGQLHLLHAWGRIDHAYIAGHTDGWRELEAILPEYPADRVARICGIPVYDLVHAARILGNARRLMTFWTMGVNQSVAGTFTS